MLTKLFANAKFYVLPKSSAKAEVSNPLKLIKRNKKIPVSVAALPYPSHYKYVATNFF